jgi:hypothetical protein
MNVQPSELAKFEKYLCKIYDECERDVNNQYFGEGKKPTKEWCNAKDEATGEKNCLGLGTAKHECCKKKINDVKKISRTKLSRKVQAEPKMDVPGGGQCIPDVIVGSPPCDAVYDFKTNCPLTATSMPKWPLYGYGPGQRKPPNQDFIGKTQDVILRAACRFKPEMIHPNSKTCKKAKGEK